MSPSEFARQMTAIGSDLDRQALETAVRSMSAIPPSTPSVEGLNSPYDDVDETVGGVLKSAEKLKKAKARTMRIQKNLERS